jgi:hypothetical protein
MSTGAWGSRVARHVGLVLLLGLAACGSSSSGNDNTHTFDLPPGTAFDTTPSNQMLLVVEAHNQCGNSRSCVATPLPSPTPGPAGVVCDTGSGNSRGLALYRLGTNGLFLENPAQPGTAMPPEQIIATADNPRRVKVSQTDPTLLFVATNQRLQVFRLLPGGGSRCIAQTKTEKESDKNAKKDLDPVGFALDPTIGNGVLYVAGRGSNRVDAYPIASDGTIADEPTNCVIGSNNSEYTSLSLLSRDFIAASGRSEVQVFRRIDGLFPPPTPAPSATPTPGSTPGCFGAQLVTVPVSEIGAAIVNDTFFTPSQTAPIGELFLSEEVSDKLFTFNIDPSGTIGSKETSSTKQDGFYQNLLRRDRPNGSFIYASVFQDGKVAVFQLENNLLPDFPLSKTAQDPKTLPVGLAVDEPNGNLLYVAEAGAGRIDAFLINPDGTLSRTPLSSTAPVTTTDGRTIDSFPNDIAIIPAP